MDDFEWPPPQEVIVDLLNDSLIQEVAGRATTPTQAGLTAAERKADNVELAEQNQWPRIVSRSGDGRSGDESALDAFESEVRFVDVHGPARPTATQQPAIAPAGPIRDFVRRDSVRRSMTVAALAIGVICLTAGGVFPRRTAVGRTAVSPTPARDAVNKSIIAPPAPEDRHVAMAPVNEPRVPRVNEPEPDAPRHDARTILNETRVPAGNETRAAALQRAPETNLSLPLVELPRAPMPTAPVDPVATSGADTSTLKTSDGTEVSPSRTMPVAQRAPAEAFVPVSASEDHGSPLAVTPSKTDGAGVTDPTRAAVARADEERIGAVLKRFTDAYAQLNAPAAKAVWPGVDTRALSHAFDALESQSIVFDVCTLYFTDSEARAACAGKLTYVPKIGRRSARTVSQQWNFVMKKNSADWTIADAQMR